MRGHERAGMEMGGEQGRMITRVDAPRTCVDGVGGRDKAVNRGAFAFALHSCCFIFADGANREVKPKKCTTSTKSRSVKVVHVDFL